MKTLEKVIRHCNEDGEKAFVPYIMAGDGGLDVLNNRLLFLQEIGVTAIEVGIPFSDPVADGEAIQQAGERALAHGTTLKGVLEMLAERPVEVTVPLIIMTYLNPILAYGIQAFMKRCKEVGIHGLIIPDLPMEESGILRDGLKDADIAFIPLVSLTSPQARIAEIVSQAQGFVYAVAVNGITGARDSYSNSLTAHLKGLKEVSPVPVLAGFGISTISQVKELGDQTDGVIVGSAIVEAFHRGDLAFIRKLAGSGI